MSGKRRRRLSKKEYEQLERKEAELQSDARSESQARQERIKVLWEEITSGELSRDAKDLAENELVRSLVDLVQLQKLEIKYLVQFRDDWEWIRRYFTIEVYLIIDLPYLIILSCDRAGCR
jgi:hypothetical protein